MNIIVLMSDTLFFRSLGYVSELEEGIKKILENKGAQCIAEGPINKVKMRLYTIFGKGVVQYLQSEEGNELISIVDGNRRKSSAHVTFAGFNENEGYFFQLQKYFKTNLRKYLVK